MAKTNIVVDDIETSGLNLSDTVWDDIRVPVLSTKTGGSKIPGLSKFIDDGSGSQGILTYVFDDSIEEELYFAVQIPHSWKYGTDIHPHIHWSPTVSGSAGQVVSWGLEYSLAEATSIFPNSIILFGNTPMPEETLVAKKHYITEFGIISMSGVTSVSSMILCRMFRDATGSGAIDDYPSDAAVFEIDFHYEIDAMGSRSEYIK